MAVNSRVGSAWFQDTLESKDFCGLLARPMTATSAHFSSCIFLQMSVVCPVFESMRVVAGRQLQVTVLAFSCLTTTQCSMTSAAGGGCWLLTGGGVPATGCFFAAHPARSRQTTSRAFLMPFVFSLSCPLVDGNLDYTSERTVPSGAPACGFVSTRWQRRSPPSNTASLCL